MKCDYPLIQLQQSQCYAENSDSCFGECGLKSPESL